MLKRGHLKNLTPFKIIYHSGCLVLEIIEELKNIFELFLVFSISVVRLCDVLELHSL